MLSRLVAYVPFPSTPASCEVLKPFKPLGEFVVMLKSLCHVRTLASWVDSLLVLGTRVVSLAASEDS